MKKEFCFRFFLSLPSKTEKERKEKEKIALLHRRSLKELRSLS
jgi:hypothetical protein